MFRLNFSKRYFSSDSFVEKMITQRKKTSFDFSETISKVWEVGVIPCGIVGMGAGVWNGITENKHLSLGKTTILACVSGFIGGAIGVVGWTTLPLTGPIFGLTYLHKKMNT